MTTSSSSVQVVTSAALPQTIINAESGAFATDFNQRPFTFSHNLAGHPLFELPRLVDLAETVVNHRGPEAVTCRVSDLSITRKWGDPPVRDQVADSLLQIQESGSWVLIKHAQEDPAYKDLLDQVMAELEGLTATQLQEQITFLDAYIFIASPNSVTQYHIDHEANFLFQINGEKDNHLFDQRDRTVLTEPELEHFYIGDLNAAKYHSDLETKASLYRLTAGQGLHHPINAPHWVKTLEGDYAISLSILFFMKPFDLKARIYQVNHYLRKLGLNPSPPGKSRFSDILKISLTGLFSERNPTTKADVFKSGIQSLLRPISVSVSSLKELKTALIKQNKRQLKENSKALLRLPVIRDFYGYFWFPRISNGFRGVFDTFEQAQRAIAQHLPVGYDQEAAHQYSARYPEQLDPSDRPLLPHLKTALETSQRVFDLGGSVGRGYYTYQNYVDYPPNLQWQVCEVPSAVAAGTELAQKRGIQNLSFTTDWQAAEGADVFITCGAIQYMQPSLADILASLAQKPRHLLIARVLCHEGPEYFTSQSILVSKQPYKLATICPYKIQNRQQFIASLEVLGYELVDHWRSNRACVIPFHPQRFIDGYDSFYFRRVEAES